MPYKYRPLFLLNIFVLLGIAALIWYIFWYNLVTNDPADDKCISAKEKSYIIAKVNRNHDKVMRKVIVFLLLYQKYRTYYMISFVTDCLPLESYFNIESSMGDVFHKIRVQLRTYGYYFESSSIY